MSCGFLQICCVLEISVSTHAEKQGIRPFAHLWGPETGSISLIAFSLPFFSFFEVKFLTEADADHLGIAV